MIRKAPFMKLVRVLSDVQPAGLRWMCDRHFSRMLPTIEMLSVHGSGLVFFLGIVHAAAAFRTGDVVENRRCDNLRAGSAAGSEHARTSWLISNRNHSAFSPQFLARAAHPRRSGRAVWLALVQ